MFGFLRRQKLVVSTIVEPPKVIPLVFCVVCRKPLVPGAPVLELRNGYLTNNQITNKEGFLATSLFIHTANSPQSCLTEYTLYHQMASLGLNLEREDLPAPQVINPAPKIRNYVDGVIPVIPIFAKLEESAPASLRVPAVERRRSFLRSSLDD